MRCQCNLAFSFLEVPAVIILCFSLAMPASFYPMGLGTFCFTQKGNALKKLINKQTWEQQAVSYDIIHKLARVFFLFPF